MRGLTTHNETILTVPISRWRSSVRRWSCVLIATLALVFFAGCGPESNRAVGGGLGADTGNHADDVPRSKLFVPGTTGTENAQP